MKHVLAIVAVSRVDTGEATEFLRVLVALCACAIPVELIEVGSGTGALSDDPALTEDGERYLKALAANRIVPTPGTDLAARIEAASDVLRLIDPSTAADAAFVRWTEVRDDTNGVERALAAGAFVRS